MILDLQNQLSDAQVLVASAISTNVIDLSADRNIGMGEPMAVLFNVDVAANAADGDETYAFAIRSAAADPPTVEIASVTIARATLVAGYQFALAVPPDTSSARYLAAYYTLGGTTPSITITAHLVPLKDVAQFVAYPAGVTVL